MYRKLNYLIIVTGAEAAQLLQQLDTVPPQQIDVDGDDNQPGTTGSAGIGMAVFGL